MTDTAKVRRESMRWKILLILNSAHPVRAREELVLAALQSAYPDTTVLELRRELDYLADRELVALNKDSSGRWFADLTRHGSDVAEYTVDCDPGIARPQKYW